MFNIDHIVFGALSLEEGTQFIEKKLDTKLSNIGYHDFMGTHNRVLKIGKNIYFEVIAIDPKSKSLNHERWFNLDNKGLQEKLKKKPQIIGYVIDTFDQKILKHYSPFFKAVREKYKWNFAIPKIENNKLYPGLIENGVMPSLINWQSEKPINKMQDSKFELENIEIEIMEKQYSYKKFLMSLGQSDKINYLVNKKDENHLTGNYPKLKISIKDNLKKKVIYL
tara:strand:+ start:266 stop:934 length:669 start_codon:yes stop_codon:yes gene_type:complete